MDAQIRLGHRRDGMTAHRRMAVQPIGRPADRGEQVAENLIAVDGRRGDDERRPGAGEDRGRDVVGMPDRAGLGRGIERRADLVLRDRRLQAAQEGENGRQFPVHPCGVFGARHAGDADAAVSRETGELCRRRHVQEQNGRHPAERQGFHDGCGAGEVVAVPGDDRIAAERVGHQAKVSRAAASAGWLRA